MGGGHGGGLVGVAGGHGGSGGGEGAAQGGAGTGIDGQGYSGGVREGTNPWHGGGGGGAGAAGYNGIHSVYPGYGGIGLASSILGVNTYYAGGGGSGADVTAGAGGLGGGGAGVVYTAEHGGHDGTDNTGGGGGGGASQGKSISGGSGGSGIVLVRYETSPITPYEEWLYTHFTSGQLTDSAFGGHNADPDRDGMDNRQEFLAGTIPTNAASLLSLSAPAINQTNSRLITLHWQSVANRSYSLQATSNLLAGFTMDVCTNITATPPTNVYSDSIGADFLFYRIQLD